MCDSKNPNKAPVQRDENASDRIITHFEEVSILDFMPTFKSVQLAKNFLLQLMNSGSLNCTM